MKYDISAGGIRVPVLSAGSQVTFRVNGVSAIGQYLGEIASPHKGKRTLRARVRYWPTEKRARVVTVNRRYLETV